MTHPHIQEVSHIAKRPVTIERGSNDLIYIEGVAYPADMFRTMAIPEPEHLYAFRRDGETVWLTTIHNLEEAKKFFGGE